MAGARYALPEVSCISSFKSICVMVEKSDALPTIHRSAKNGAATLRKFEGSLRETLKSFPQYT